MRLMLRVLGVGIVAGVAGRVAGLVGQRKCTEETHERGGKQREQCHLRTLQHNATSNDQNCGGEQRQRRISGGDTTGASAGASNTLTWAVHADVAHFEAMI